MDKKVLQSFSRKSNEVKNKPSGVGCVPRVKGRSHVDKDSRKLEGWVAGFEEICQLVEPTYP